MNRSLLFGALLACSAAAFAQTSTDSTKAGERSDPNEVICRRVPVIGSRVNTERICHTRAEWAESRRVNRTGIDQATAAKPTSGN